MKTLFEDIAATGAAVLRSVPPYVLFLAGFAAAVAYGLARLYGMLQDNGLGA